MAIQDGQRVRALESNAAWASKQNNNTFEGVQSLENAGSGGNIANVQQKINDNSVSIAQNIADIAQNAADILSNNGQIVNLQTLSGEAANATQHVGFTGSTFSDGNTREVLQEAETAIEARIPLTQKGAVNGVAELDGSGTVPASQLPSYVDDVLEFADLASFPVTGETGKIYIAIDTSRTYRWTGSVYLDITGKVDSVNSQTGTVVLDLDDINDVTIASLAARDVIRRNPGDTAFENFNPNQIVDDSTTGSNVTLASVSENSIVRLTSGTLVSVDMIPAGYSGQKFVLINRTGVQISISNETGATAANHVITGTGASLDLADDAALVLAYDGTTAKWQIVGGSGGGGAGANDTLSNLASPTSINQDLLPDGNNTRDIGSDSVRFAEGNFGTSIRLGAASGEGLQIIDAQGSPNGAGDTVAVKAIEKGKILSVFTENNADADAVFTGRLILQTGNKSAGTGWTGNIEIQTGSSTGSSGNRGSIFLDGRGIVIDGNTKAFIQGNLNPFFGNQNIGVISGPWGNVHSNQVHATSNSERRVTLNATASQTLPSGNSVDGSISKEYDGNPDLGIFTGNDAGANANPTGDLFIDTGNKTAGTGNSGSINLLSGSSNGGSTGNFIFQSGNKTGVDSGGNTGNVFLRSGFNSAPSGNTGNLTIDTGDSTNGNSGSIEISTGTAPSGTRGVVTIIGRQINHSLSPSHNVVWEYNTTANRPGSPVNGQRYFDSTLGIPIWYHSGNWVNATGATV